MAGASTRQVVEDFGARLDRVLESKLSPEAEARVLAKAGIIRESEVARAAARIAAARSLKADRT